MPTISSTNGLTTQNGTPIVKGTEVDKDMFLKILAAEMQHQDPFAEQDPTAYVTQLAQFAQMEQSLNMSSLIEDLVSVNNGMLINNAMATASNLIGKNVEVVDSSDMLGTKYNGIVESTHIKDSVVYLNVRVEETGELKSFTYGDLLKVSMNKQEESSSNTITEKV